ncbi:MAG: amino acid ABC transporter substrate-binding protein [Candidatus Electrothrix sp. LOE1_4_5]|nr:amino acid ABC transporter substrate-binding protein [Candidatus Electrothrix gigas]
MKKKNLIFFCCISMGIVAVYFTSKSPFLVEQEPVYIAVVGPMKEPGGKAMQEGVEFYGEQINKQGGIDGRKVEFIFRDDQNDPKVAQRIAHALAGDNKVLAVLGHYYSSTSSVAGKIYKKNGIPALTASATVESVIQDNEWYFRTVPGNAFEAQFVASYMKKIINFSRNKSLKKELGETIPVSIIFSKDDYGISFLKKFKNIAKQFRIAIKGKWGWDYKKSSAEQIQSITKELAAIDDPGVIYFVTHATEGVQVITGLKDAGGTYPMIASAALARNFFHEVKSYSKERETPGYYSDGIYFVSPYITALSGVEGVEFQASFFEKYKRESGVVSSCYYDAAHVIAQAIKTSGIQGKKHIREDRRNIRKALAGMSNEDKAIKGVTGKLWFDKNGSVRKEYAMGIWQKQKELPAFVQYKKASGGSDYVLQEALDGDVLFIDGLVMHSTHIVYVGVEHFKLININKKKLEFTAEFDLRFRYPIFFDTPSKGAITSPVNIQFTNASSALVIKKRKEEIKNNIKTQIIHVQPTVFWFNPNRLLSGYCPLSIGIRNKRLPYHSIIYFSEKKIVQADQLPTGWSIQNIMTFSNILSKKTTLGVPAYLDSDHTLNYSRFNITTMVDNI